MASFESLRRIVRNKRASFASSFARDNDDPEKAEPVNEQKPIDAGWKQQSTKAPSGGLPNRDFLRDDSPIWPLYINEALEEARESAELWRTNLDALLVFAGLFAGVVATFAVDARQDLLPNSEQSLLEGILKGVHNEPSEDFELNQMSVWINGLWFFSLHLTLFSAIVGGIVKSWLVKFGTALRRQDSDDAYQRWLLDVRRLHLERTISVVPCLLHLALTFFAGAFALQSLQDHPMIGRVMVATVLLGIIIYAALTFAPLWYPDHPLPLNTPFSDLIVGLKQIATGQLSSTEKISWDKPEDPYFPKSSLNMKQRVLAFICRVKLLSSPNPKFVDEAIAEIAQLSNDDWLEYFVNYRIADVCVRRIQECISQAAVHREESSRDQALRLHLKALLYLSAWAERKSSVKSSASFRADLKGYLKPGQPLKQWNLLPEPLRPLVFSLRVFIHLDLDDGQDFSREEVDEQSWEVIANHSGHPMQRISFAMAACRAIASEAPLPNLQGVSALSICLNIINAAHAGSTSEWPEEMQDREVSFAKGRDHICHLLKQLVHLWERTFVEHSANPVFDDPESPDANAARVSFPLATVLQMILYDTDKTAHKTYLSCFELLDGVKVLDEEISDIPGILCSPHHPSIEQNELKQVISQMSPYLHSDGFIDRMEAHLIESITTKPLDIMTDVLSRLPTFLECRLIRNSKAFISTVIVPVTISPKGADFRGAGRRALKALTGSLWNQDMLDLNRNVLEALQTVFKSSGPGHYLFDIFSELEDFEKNGMGEIIVACVPDAVKVTLESGSSDKKRMAAILALWSQSQHGDKIVIRLSECFEDFGPLLDTPSADLRIRWLGVLAGFAERALVPKAIDQLIHAGLNDADAGVRAHAVNSLSTVFRTKHWQESAAVETVQNILNNSLNLKLDANSLGGNKAVHEIEALRDASFDMLAILIQCPSYDVFLWDMFRRAVGVEVLELLAQQSSALSKADGLETPSMEELPFYLQSLAKSNKRDDRILAIRILCISARQKVPAVSVILHLLSFTTGANEGGVKAAALTAIGDVIDHEKGEGPVTTTGRVKTLSATLKIPQIISRLIELAATDDDDDVRTTGITVVAKISNSFNVPIAPEVRKRLKKDKSPLVHAAWATCFAKPAHLIATAMEDPHEDVRKAAHSRLTEMIANSSLDTKTTVAAITSSLATPESPLCHRPFRILKSLVSNPQPSQMEVANVIKLEVRHILAAAVKEDNNAVNELAREIFHQLREWKLPAINAAIILALPRVVDSMDSKGAHMMTTFFSKLDVSTESYTLATADIAHVLESGHWYSKQIVVEGLLIFCRKCESDKAPTGTSFMKSLVDTVAQLAIHDKDEGLRQRCVRLLIQLLRQDRPMHSKKLRGYRARFMSLLEVKSLRPLAAELISLLCIIPNSRCNVAIWMLRSVAESKDGQLDSVAELLSRLILDKRLKVDDSSSDNEDHLSPEPPLNNDQYGRVVALDYVLVLLASVLMMRPSLANHRFRLATALLGNYRDVASQEFQTKLNIPESLIKWFLFMVFGQHVTNDEVNIWLTREG